MIAVVAIDVSCSRQDDRIQEHQKNIHSLVASTKAAAEAWLGGSTSATFTCTAFEEMFRLVEEERSTLASQPEALLDPRGAKLSQSAERLSRLLALMMRDVRAADAPSLRAHLIEVEG